MKLDDVIRELQNVRDEHGNIEVHLQDEETTHYEDFFIMAEPYTTIRSDDQGDTQWDEVICCIRSWPY